MTLQGQKETVSTITNTGKVLKSVEDMNVDLKMNNIIFIIGVRYKECKKLNETYS